MLLPLLLSLASPADSPTQVGETALAPDTEARWVPFELTPSNHIRFDALIDGRPVRAILDTGFTDSVVSPAFARLPKRARGVRAIATGGGDVELVWAHAETIAVGGLTRVHARIGIASAATLAPFGVDMVIGSDLLGCCALEIDFDARRFRILVSGRLPFTGNTTPLKRSPAGLPITEVGLADRRIRPMMLDTGDGTAVTFTRGAWQSAGYAGARFTTTIGTGVSGVETSEIAIVAGLVFAGIVAPAVEARIENDDGHATRTGLAGRIGTGLLRHYRVLIDPRAGRLVVAPGKEVAAPPIRSTSGIMAEFNGTALRVVHVMRGSPAEKGGWKVGELICSADGVAVAEDIKDGMVEWPVGTPGRVVRVGLCDGGERSLTLANFY